MQENKGTRRNALLFGIFTIVIHIIACFMFGFYFRLPAQITGGEFYPLFIVFATGVFVLIGFGLLFSYLRKMLWSGMGFTLLIAALSVQFYFMINAFWTKAVIQYTNTPNVQFTDTDKSYSFYLTNLSADTNYMATLTGAFRCALANIIAFSAILGRGGPLDAFIVVIFGTIGYELNRQIIENYTNDSGGSSAIFVFGGFFGLLLGFLKTLREKGESSTQQHVNYTANRTSATFALIGTLLTWIFFPILGLDYIDVNVSTNTPYTGAYSIIFSLCAATLTSFAISPLFNNGVLIRDVIYGPIAGGVASATASYWIVNPVYALVIGVVSALLQVIVMNLVQKKVARERSIFNTFSFTLFGGQGLLGAIFAAIWNAAIRSNTYNFDYTFSTNQVFSWIISLISLPMGVAFGAAAGVLCMLISTHRREDHFDDFTYWINDDGIRTFRDVQQPQQVSVPVPIADTELGVRERSHFIKGKQAYL